MPCIRPMRRSPKSRRVGNLLNQKIQIMNYFIHCLKNYANFNGRARRKEFWMFALFSLIFGIVFALLDNVLGTTISFNLPQGPIKLPYGYLYFAFSFVLLVPGLAVGFRRMHDVGKSGWLFIVFYGLTVLCLVGIFPLIYFMVKAGDAGENQFGPDPKA